MAAAFRSIASTTYASRTNTTVSAPAGIVNDDILIAAIFVGASGSSPAVTPPSGFTLIGTPTVVADGTSFTARFSIYWKRAASESGSYTFTHAAGSSQAIIVAVSGALASGSPIDVSSSNSLTNPGSGGNTAIATGVTTTGADDLLLYVAHDWEGLGALSPPSGMTERFDGLVYAASQALTASGATGNKTQTNGNAASGMPWAAWLVAIKSAAAGGPVTTPQTVSVAGVTAVAAVKQGRKTISAACSDVTAVQKQVGKAIAATSATVESVIKRAGKGISAVSATSALANATRAFLKTVSATLTGSVSVSRQARKIASATSATATTVRKAVGKPIAVASSAAGAIAKRAGKTLAATSSSLASVTARAAVTIAKSVAVSCASGVSLTKAIAKRVSATLSLSALINAALSVIIPSPIDPRRKAGAAATAEGRTLAALAETRVAQTVGEYRAVTAPEERRSASAQQERPRTAAPTSIGRRNTV